MRLLVAGVFHETNTFAPGKTEIEQFQGEWVERTGAYFERYTGTRTSMGGLIDAAAAENAELVCGAYLSAMPSAMVSASAAETLLDKLVSTVDAEADGIIVILHGAMVAEGIADMEAEVLQRIRIRVGPHVPIAITLDMHANVSQEMLDHVQIVTGYDTYPHVDAYERAVEALVLLARTVRGEITPVQVLARPGMLIVPPVMLTDEAGPMRELMDRAFEMEREPGVLSIMVAGGFPYSDVPAAGMAFVVTTDGDSALAQGLANELSLMAWERRERFVSPAYLPADALRLAMEEPKGPVVLVEGSDNVGGGAPGDATFLLGHLVNAPVKSLIVIYDPEAVKLAHRLGVGGAFETEIGGKSDRLHGDPVAVRGRIRLLFDGKYTHIGAYMTGQRADMGLTAVIEVNQLTLIVTERRTAPWDPGHVVSLGLRAEDYHIITVKAAIAWKTAFGDICTKSILVDTPGCCAVDVNHFNYKQIVRPIYPLDRE
ncbi:microcystinase C [Paenibacillus baekrokdamisoli]|uniref:Microcystinase C n=1 Tax=Paenibacillus baekrokdamisoli TaxID=1712516 RepID=A0A3G9JKS7_9BACL|nr:M81 family metallopeptidase [Paenibacillus baekrokdamisoli]MBB3068692.1 microcystin degradation protein MlrC [Paenibacillus baekrokdamisoli]BBH23524.1 microcystinase C [Paenibacillus baekrokdamisoli]